MTSRLRMLGAAALTIALVSSQVPAAPVTQNAGARDTQGVAEACSDISRSSDSYEACANAIEARIAGDPTLLKKLTDDVQNNQHDLARPTLEMIGVPASQLRNAKISLTGHHPDASERFKIVSVTISCCPLTITIVIKL